VPVKAKTQQKKHTSGGKRRATILVQIIIAHTQKAAGEKSKILSRDETHQIQRLQSK